MTAYYNEIDPFAAAWLRELIKAGQIAPGEVDERSIADVMPSDLAGFTQCHFFAGIGVWSYALRQAGWADDRPVWTGSCPCQPFSSAGKGKGFKDERHLWPEFYRLISQCRPTVCFGEQVASKDGLAWVNLVQDNMENAGYAFGSVDTCAAGVGAPHIRQRLYWVADAEIPEREWGWPAWPRRQGLTDNIPTRRMDYTLSAGLEGYAGNGNGSHKPGRHETYTSGSVAEAGGSCRVADSNNMRLEQATSARLCTISQHNSESCCRVGWLAHATSEQEYQEQQRPAANEARWCADEPRRCSMADTSQNPGPTNGFWRDADWLYCRDGKWRATQSIAVEMADGLADRLGYSRFGDRWSLNPLIQKAKNRVGRLKGYGNAINAEQAKAFIEAFMEVSQ